MDFRFSVNKLLPKRINKITHTLIPEGFRGDRREYNDSQRLLTRILEDIGEASAKAQGLNKTITSAAKIRDTDHIIYLMVDNEANNGLGSLVGLLKTGSKSLFMFDENGLHYKLKPRCILDFYIHESRQRMGLGNELYQYMLAEENLKPIKLAIDRPSDKFLAFLNKYYGLSSIISQNNKFVVFKGFFDDEIQDNCQPTIDKYNYSSSASSRRPPSDYDIYSNNNVNSPRASTNGIPATRSAYGRFAAGRPHCSMANIIHNSPMVDQSPERISRRRPSSHTRMDHSSERPGSLGIFTKQDDEQSTTEEIVTGIENITTNDQEPKTDKQEYIKNEENYAPSEPAANDVPDTVTEVDSIEDNSKDVRGSPTCSQDADSGDQPAGHLDLKFYHSPLW